MKIETPTATLQGDSIEEILEKYGRRCLRGADLYGVDLSNADMEGADMTGADLRNACLVGATLRYACLADTYMHEANMRGADMYCINLHNADLHNADLRGAILWHATMGNANLCTAVLDGADICFANLRNANLHCAGLRGARLRGARLTDAYMCRANLRGANLLAADLTGVDMTGVDLAGAIMTMAKLTDAENTDIITAKTRILPDEGDIIGWKKARDIDGYSVIVKLLIPSDAQRSNGSGRKCRASKAKVLDLQYRDGSSLEPGAKAYSEHSPSFTYKVGETVEVEDFDTDRWKECTTGIHFFITRLEACRY